MRCWRWASGGAVLADVARLAWLAVRERAGRSALAALGVFIAFLALATALSIGETFKGVVEEAFQRLGLNTVWILPRFRPLTEADVATVSALLPTAVVIPMTGEGAKARLPDGSERDVMIYYVPPEAVDVLIPRDALKSGVMSIGGSLALVSTRVKMAGDVPLEPGMPVTLERSTGPPLEVTAAGVVDLSGIAGPLGGGDVFVDRALSAVEGYALIYVITDSPQTAEKAAARLTPYFPDATILSPQVLARQVGQFAAVAQLGLGVLAGVSALITAMWLYDTMTISILQRTKEIGIMRAVGFKRRHILAVILAESLIVIAMGIAAALPALFLISQISIPIGFGAALKLKITPVAVLASAAVVLAANLLGALAPAYRASRLNIVDALRYE